jgi:hypothetical protein
MKEESLRDKSLEWFFGLDNFEKEKLKNKYYPKKHIEYTNHWGYAFTFGQIEEMYKQSKQESKC